MRVELNVNGFLRRLLAVSGALLMSCLIVHAEAASAKDFDDHGASSATSSGADAAWSRQQEVIRLGSIRPVTPDIVSQLVATLRDESIYVRAEAVRRIGEIGPEAKSAIPDLLALLSDHEVDPIARTVTPWALGAVGKGDPRVLDVLLRVAKDPASGLITRSQAVQALGSMGKSAQQTETALQDLAMTGAPAIVQVSAWEAIMKINPENSQAVKALLTIAAGDPGTFAEGVEGVQSAAFSPVQHVWQALSEAGFGSEIFPHLVKALAHERLEVNAVSLDLLSKMGPNAKPAIPAIIRILNSPTKSHDHRALKGYAVGALLRIDPQSKDVLSALEALKSFDPELYTLAQRGLERVELDNSHAPRHQ